MLSLQLPEGEGEGVKGERPAVSKLWARRMVKGGWYSPEITYRSESDASISPIRSEFALSLSFSYETGRQCYCRRQSRA